MSSEPDDGVSDGGDSSVDAPSYGRSSSGWVTFSGPGLAALDLTPPRDEDDPTAPPEQPAALADQPAAYRELGEDAVWLLSSAKVGNGVEQLRDQDPLTFWQSDGVLPHALTIQFHKMTRVSHVCLFLDQKLDESYSPSRISVRVGNGSAAQDATMDGQTMQQGVREMDKFDIEEPQGWLVVHLTRKDGDSSSSSGDSGPANKGVRCHFVQVVVLNSFQNGRDTHVRQVKVFGPRQAAATRGMLADLEHCTSREFKQFACIR